MTHAPGAADAAPDIVGRALELETVERFLAILSAGGGGATALLIEGDAGVGKSLLWRSAVALARGRSMDVLDCRPTAAEQALSFVALRDLLDDLPTESVERLPQPQRLALGVALLRSAADASMDQGALGVALTAVIRDRSGTGATIVAVDDAQWLDGPTARMLAFAVRRLTTARVGFLLTRRSGEDASLFQDIESALGDTAQRLRLGPISFGALHRLLSVRTGHRFARPVVARIERASGGNPMTALEIARALLETGAADPAPDEELPVPQRLRDLLNARLARLSTVGQAVLQIAAAMSHPTMDLVTAASDDGAAAREGLLEAAVADIIVIDGSALRFSHPLLAAVVQAAATPVVRRAVHQRLSAIAASDEERAHHLGLATMDPDAAVADVLEAVAVQTTHRGAPDVGAGLLARAGALTPIADVEARSRRSILEAEALLEAGDLSRSASVLEGSLDRIPPGRQRAEALLLLGTVQSYADRPRATRTLGRALTEPALDPTVRGRIYSRLALFEDDAQVSRAHARAAVALIDPAVAPSTLAFAMFGCFYAEVIAGLPPDLAMFAKALDVEPATPSWEVSTIPALWWKYTDQLDLARVRLDRHLRWARETGDESSDADLFAHVAELELYAGEWSRADAAAVSSMEAAEQTGQAMPDPSHRVRALVDTHLGRLDVAIPAAAAGAAACRGTDPELEAMYLDVLGTARLAAGDDRSAVGSFDRMREVIDALGVREPLRHRTEPDHIEALIGVGASDRAALLLGELERRHERLPRPWIEVALPRLRALVQAAGGDAAGGAVRLAESLPALADGLQPQPSSQQHAFAVARGLLVLGGLERRLGHRRIAGQRLDQAVALFDALPAPVWAARARQQIDRLGRNRGAGERLTPAEARVVELSARGLTNRAVADRLVLSPKTVEAHLARAYAKLGVRSRAELGRRLASPDATPGEAGDSTL